MRRRLLPALLLACPAFIATAQSVILNERTITPQEWTRLRTAVESMRSEDSTRKLYRSSPGIQEAFPAETFFLSYVAKWRSRLEPLARERSKATTVSLTLKELEDGEEWFLTYHHSKPLHAITVVKTAWKDGQIRNIMFTRGFTEVNRGRR